MDSSAFRLGVVVASLAALAGVLYLVVHFAPKKTCPRLQSVHLVSTVTEFALSEQSKADDTWKSVRYGEKAVLAAVARFRDMETGEDFYVSPIPDVKIDGDKIPPEKIRSFPPGCGLLIFIWFKVEAEGTPGSGTERR